VVDAVRKGDEVTGEISTKIVWIDPVGTGRFLPDLASALGKYKKATTDLEVRALTRGPVLHLEHSYYAALSLLDTLHAVKRAEIEGFDAAIIGCFYDLGLAEAREVTEDLVVTAPCEASLHAALALGDSISILVGRRKSISIVRDNITRYGMGGKIRSIRAIGMSVVEIQANRQKTLKCLEEVGRYAIENDHAEVLVLGCTAFEGYEALQQSLAVPVVEARLAGLKFAEWLVELKKRLGWKHSKVGRYESPSTKEIVEWRLAEQYPGMKGLWTSPGSTGRNEEVPR